MSAGPRYSKAEARAAIAASKSWAEALRRLGVRSAGGNQQTLRRYAHEVWEISTEHFDPSAARPVGARAARPLDTVLVKGSSYNRHSLKLRLYDSGLKNRACERCGQGEVWRGRAMALILDHVNGVADDNRLENLQIVCPNCAATLDTHCGRSNRRTLEDQPCARCGRAFRPGSPRQRYCSRACGVRWDRDGRARPNRRRVDRPPYGQLVREIEALGFMGVGRRYGVSDNAIRKWLRQYERERT